MSRYKPYPAYKDSEVEWIGQIPEHWEVARIKRHASIRTERRSDVSVDATYIGLEDVESESGKYKPTNSSSRQTEDSTVGIFYEQDVLYGKLRPYLRKAIVANMNGACSTEFLVLRTSKTLPRWLHQWLLTNDVTQQIEAGCEGAKMPRADWEHVGSIKMPSPCSEEQSAIISALDRETTRIDALIAKKTRFIELLKEKRQALITHSVTRGLNPNVKMKDSGVEWIGEVPEHWDIKRLRHVAIFSNSNVDKKSYEDQKEVRLCNYTDVYYNEFITSELEFMSATASDSEIEKFQLRKGDVIITKDSEDPCDIGVPALVTESMTGVVCGYHLTVIRTFEPSFSGFIHRTIQADTTKAHLFVRAPGITRFGLNQDAIGDIQICVPPKDEYELITTSVNKRCLQIDLMIESSKRSISLLKERRSAFITAAVTGQIDLREGK